MFITLSASQDLTFCTLLVPRGQTPEVLKNVVPTSIASTFPGNLLERPVLGPSLDQWKQKLWGWDQQLLFDWAL